MKCLNNRDNEYDEYNEVIRQDHEKHLELMEIKQQINI